MHLHRKAIGPLALLVLATVLSGCTGNVHLGFSPLPPIPFVAPDNSGRFGANFNVLNETNKEYAPGAFRVKLFASYETIHTVNANTANCVRNHIIPVSGLLEANTGKYQVSTFEFHDPYAYDPSSTCGCSTATQCQGLMFLELQRANGERAPGRYSKAGIQWAKSGELADMQLWEEMP